MAKKIIPKKVKQQITQYINILKQDKLPIKKIILFGSYAKGNQHKWSDIDLCVISSKFQNVHKALEYLWSKRRITDIQYTVEPIGYSPKDFVNTDPLVWEIKKTGIIIESN